MSRNPWRHSQFLLAGMYNRRVTSVSQILDRLEFYSLDPDDDPSRTFFHLFQLHLRRWLQGRGHPPSLRGTIISEEMYDRDVDDPLVRAKAFLLAISDSELLPMDSGEKFTVRSHIIASSIDLMVF